MKNSFYITIVLSRKISISVSSSRLISSTLVRWYGPTWLQGSAEFRIEKANLSRLADVLQYSSRDQMYTKGAYVTASLHQ